MSDAPTQPQREQAGHLELTDLYAKFVLEHPEAAALIETNRAAVIHHLTHNQKRKEVTLQPAETEIGKHFQEWIKDPMNRKKFDAQMPSDKFLIVYSLYIYNISPKGGSSGEWKAQWGPSRNQFINDMRTYTGKDPRTNEFFRALQIDGFLDTNGAITKSGFNQIKRILGMN